VDTGPYDEAIQKAIEHKATIKQRLDDLAAEYAEAVAAHIADDIRKMVERSIAEHPSVIQEMGAEKISEFKAKVNQLLAQIPDTARAKLSKPEIWKHNEAFPEGFEKNYGSISDLKFKQSDQLDDALRELLGYGGEILIQHGLAKSGDHSEWKYKTPKRLRYSYGLPNDIEQRIKDAKNRYHALFSEFVDADIAITKKTNERLQAIAKDMWDQA
jgi:hypothetical protein